MQNYSNAAFLLLLGWCLGILSMIVREDIRRGSQKKAFKYGLSTELQDAKFRLTATVEQINRVVGAVDRKLLKWVRSHLEGSEDIFSQDIVKATDQVLQLSDDELSALEQQAKAEAKGGLSLRKTDLTYLNSNLRTLSLFDPKFQQKILNIKTQINLLNGDADEAQFYHRLTFDPSIGDRNYRTVCDHLDTLYRRAGSRSYLIVEAIDSVLEELGGEKKKSQNGQNGEGIGC